MLRFGAAGKIEPVRDQAQDPTGGQLTSAEHRQAQTVSRRITHQGDQLLLEGLEA